MITVIYYTSNREPEDFESTIRQKILETIGDLPLISVSQKPIDFGKNICVGEVGASGFNMFRQVQIACREAKTKFVVSAEADCLYPKEYFEFIPPRDDACYREKNLYVLRRRRNEFHKKKSGATHAQVIGREFYLETLDYLFGDAPEWSTDEYNFPKERHRQQDVFKTIEWFSSPYPVVQIKTSYAMRHYTTCFEDQTYPSLPLWGTVEDVKKWVPVPR